MQCGGFRRAIGRIAARDCDMPENSTHDLVVLGTGTAGSTIAETCRKGGSNVTAMLPDPGKG